MSSNGNGSKDWKQILLAMLPDLIKQFPVIFLLIVIVLILLYQNNQLFERCIMLPGA